MSILGRVKFTAMTMFAVVAVATPALAVGQVSTPVTLTAADIGSIFTINYNGFVDEALVNGLAARTRFHLTSISGNQKTWTFAIDEVANLSAAPITGSRVSIFGFDVDRPLAGATATGTFDKIGIGGNVPMVGTLDVCFRAGGGGTGCSGGGGGGVELGDSVTNGSFVLKFANAANQIVLDNFFVRYQSIAGTNRGDSGVGLAVPGNGVVPEPGVWLHMIAGFGLAGVAVRRRRRHAELAA